MAILGGNSVIAVIKSTFPILSVALRWQSARLTRITQRTDRLSSFHFALTLPFSFLAGQHVDLRLTAPDGYQAQRSYSIASAPETSGEIELAIERLDGGEVSSYFHAVAAVGDEVELRGPIGGHFVWSVAQGGPLFLVGGGSGVVPLMSMIRHHAAQASRLPVVLLYSARTWNDLGFRDELVAFDKKREGFELIITLTREPARRPRDYARRIDVTMISDALNRLADPPKHVFVCGGNQFVETASQELLDALVPASVIRTERFGG